MRKVCGIIEKISIYQFYRKYGFFILNTAFYRAEYDRLSSKTWQCWTIHLLTWTIHLFTWVTIFILLQKYVFTWKKNIIFIKSRSKLFFKTQYIVNIYFPIKLFLMMFYSGTNSVSPLETFFKSYPWLVSLSTHL